MQSEVLRQRLVAVRRPREDSDYTTHFAQSAVPESLLITIHESLIANDSSLVANHDPYGW